ncbi:hypothetical protein PRZ48_013737 [Zasmidium cellare]|uniref:ubiquitinyl hydrolase 1 n=1 Tax=Zasmidium cellare TaxID=395010 RepID=A0ABR0E1V4_ZASCE|nr:hypothetical protein PRZ48_013737 [Zasmidium cellare]
MSSQRQPVATASSYYAHQHHPHHHQHPHHHPSLALHPPHPAAFSPAPPSVYHDPAALASLAYRPLQLPLQHATHQQQTASSEQTQLPLAAQAAGPYQHPSFRQHHSNNNNHHHQLSHRSRAQARQRQLSAMAYQQPPTPASPDDELAQLQKLSEAYEPETTGPLVGQRQPSTAITTEYASADPVYQAKTAALPQKYSHYRTVRGDGKCGWRAVAFGYFEALIHHGDPDRFAMEEARLRSMMNVMVEAGFQAMMIEEFAEETISLLRKVAEAIPLGTAEDALSEAFNDQMTQDYIITHIRTITAAWMKTHDENYAPWLLGQTVDQYCNQSVLPMAAEIDHVGLVALKDALLSPAGMSLEVLYLDRSEGSEVTMHRFDPVNAGGYTIGSVRLLYRPGHYDLLYKPEDLPAPPPPPAATAVPTYLQYGSSHDPVYDLGVSDFMTSIPGMSYANLSQPGWMSSSYASGVDFLNTPAPVQACTQALPTPSAPAPQPQISSQPVYVPASTPSQMVPPPTQMPHELAIRTSVAQPSLAHNDFQHQLSIGPFRASAWQYEPDFVSATSQMPFQTSIFRNSHFNTAHFLNPEFQPEQWDPDDEYATATSSTSSKGSRHKTNG